MDSIYGWWVMADRWGGGGGGEKGLILIMDSIPVAIPAWQIDHIVMISTMNSLTGRLLQIH